MFSITGISAGKTSRLASENKLLPFPFPNYHTLPLSAKSGAQECSTHVVPLNSPKNEYPQKPKSFKNAKIFRTTRRPVISSTFQHTQSDRLSALSIVLPRPLLQSSLRLASAVGFVVLRIVLLVMIRPRHIDLQASSQSRLRPKTCILRYVHHALNHRAEHI